MPELARAVGNSACSVRIQADHEKLFPGNDYSGGQLDQGVLQAFDILAVLIQPQFLLNMFEVVMHGRLRLVEIAILEMLQDLSMFVRAAIVFVGVAERGGDQGRATDEIAHEAAEELCLCHFG